ncbi:MAG: prepilin-type N-terminal cleavage/methylation domain-containing protein [Solirubrobacteraceae bacterium]|nr:prepilin-type N-terminal cleavage/methylation domain-containing protein [Solirubrobacteraceae bacterium]
MLRLSLTPKAAARQVRRDERGMTLVEMLVGITIGTIMVFAGYAAVDAATKLQGRTAMRIEAINRGRGGMEAIAASIRAQQCFNSERPMRWASGNGMEFYASVAPESTSANRKQPVERHRIEWTGGTTGDIGDGKAANNTSGDITRTIWRSTVNPTTGVVQWPTQPTSVSKIATGVQPAPDRRDGTKMAPLFRYFKYASTTGSGRVDLTSPVVTNPDAAQTDLAGIVLIEISYQVTPRKTAVAKSKPMNFHNTVSVRIADPTNPAGSPQCL